MNDGILQSTYRFSGSGIYFAPPPGPFQASALDVVRKVMKRFPLLFRFRRKPCWYEAIHAAVQLVDAKRVGLM